MFDLFTRFVLSSVFIGWGLSELLYYPLTRERFRVTVAFAVLLISLLFLTLGFVDFYESGSLVIAVTFAVRLGLTLLGCVFISRRLIQLFALIRFQNEFINRVYLDGFIPGIPDYLPGSYLERLRAAGWTPGTDIGKRDRAGITTGMGGIAKDADLSDGEESPIRTDDRGVDGGPSKVF